VQAKMARLCASEMAVGVSFSFAFIVALIVTNKFAAFVSLATVACYRRNGA
jgi:hypothetical protein